MLCFRQLTFLGLFSPSIPLQDPFNFPADHEGLDLFSYEEQTVIHADELKTGVCTLLLVYFLIKTCDASNDIGRLLSNIIATRE